ncbi:MAG: RNA polymerase sigma factor [Actinomycetota bacterium]
MKRGTVTATRESTMNLGEARMSEHELRACVDRAVEGNRDALGALFDQFFQRVYRFAYVRLGSVSDAEEATQETFTQMVRSIGRFRWRGSTFEAWLFRIARNIVSDEHRRRVRRAEDLRSEVAEGAAAPSAEDSAVARVEADRIRALLATLPEQQRRVLELRFAAGLSADDAGRVLGKSAGAVRIQQMRALQSLRLLVEAPQ